MWHGVFMSERQIINSLCWEFIFQLHQNSFRADTVLDGVGIEDSIRQCVFGEMASFPLILAWTARPDAVWGAATPLHREKASSQESDCDCVVNRWKIKDWTTGCITVNIGYTSRPITDYDYMYDFKFLTLEEKKNAFFFSNEIWWFNS